MNPAIIIPNHSLGSILILYFLGLGLSNSLLSSGFPAKILYVLLTSSGAGFEAQSISYSMDTGVLSRE
jgi:hypothetical protein